MKRKILSLLAFALPFFASAQKTNPAPYCVSEFNNNYNMLGSISLGAYTHSFGVMGSVSVPNTYLYVDTASFPPISTSLTSSLLIDFYSTPDEEPGYFGVWIDYNQNNTFESSELIMTNETLLKTKLPFGTASGVALPLSFKAPTSAKPGKTRMRIVRGEKVADPTGPYDATFVPDPCNTKPAAGNLFGCTFDFDVTIFSTGDIDEQLLRSQINVLPNPAKDFISINNSSTVKIEKISVFDFGGKKLYEHNDATQNIDVSSFATGMYFVKLTLENGAQLPFRFMKQ